MAMSYAPAHVPARDRCEGPVPSHALLHVHGHVLLRLTAVPDHHWTRGPGRNAPEQLRAAC
jgi:hypothetical protein